MDHVALRLPGTPAWVHLGGKDDAKKPLEVVVRSFDRAVEFATGEDASEPTGDALRIPAGEGRRLAGKHFFARVVEAGDDCRITVRGV